MPPAAALPGLPLPPARCPRAVLSGLFRLPCPCLSKHQLFTDVRFLPRLFLPPREPVSLRC